MKVLHIINSLNPGGAETFLCRLISNDEINQHVVITLKKGGILQDYLISKNIIVYPLNFNNFLDGTYYFFKVIYLISKIKPDVVQTWLYVSDLIGGIAAKIANVKSILWTVRASLQNKGEYKLHTSLIRIMNSKLSYFIPNKIIFCSERIMHEHILFGYKGNISKVINNGVDLFEFSCSTRNSKEDILSSYFIKNQLRFVMVANFIAQKDHLNLLRAISLLSDKNYNFKVLFVGMGLKDTNNYIVKLIKEKKLERYISIYGYSDKIPLLLKNVDFLILSSKSEGFPNVIIEAMSTGIPCISTDVGDASKIIVDTGWVCPPENPEYLANCIEMAINCSKKEIKTRSSECINIVKKNYDIKKIVRNYMKVYGSIL